MFKFFLLKKLHLAIIVIFALSAVIATTDQALAATTPYFTRDLRLGSTGNDVKELQKYLNSHNFPVASSGFGSAGNETANFGQKTKVALIKFQNFYADKILIPLGLNKGTGNFFPFTRKFVNDSLKEPEVVPEITVPTTTLLTSSIANFPTSTVASSSRNSNQYVSSGGGGGGVVITYYTPTITNFNDITKTYGDEPFSLSASSTSVGALTYESSNTDVATIEGSTVTIHSGGSSTITLYQAAASSFTSTTQSVLLTVDRLAPIITNFNDLSETYDGSTITLSASSTSGGSLSFLSNNTDVATVSGTTMTILSHGTSLLTVIQEAYFGNYSAASSTATLTVSEFCSRDLCSGYGNCLLGVAGSFTCVCDDGFTGDTCDTGVNQCLSNPCEYGTCSRSGPLLSSYTCACNVSGITGHDCDIGIDQCASNPCGLNGVCTRTSTIESVSPPLNSYFCTCSGGWAGTDCDVIGTTPSISFAAIYKTIGDDPFTFFITSNSTGTFSYSSSNTDVATVSGNVCTIHATGTSTITVDQLAHGVFLSGHTTTLMSVYPDLCIAEEPCLNGGTCTNAPGTDLGFTCSCASGFSGSICESDSSNCSAPGYCLNEGICTATPAHGECACTACFFGPQCENFSPECA